MDDYVAKPIEPDVLARAIDEQLPGGDEPDRAAGESPVPDITDEVVLDRQALVDRVMGDEEIARMILDTFLEHTPEQIASLKAAIASESLDDVERGAHTIKGSAANIGGDALTSVAREMEAAARAGNLEGTAALTDMLDEQFARLKEAAETA